MLLVVYRSPYSQVNPVTTNALFDKFETHLDSLIVKSDKLMIIVDLTFRMDNLTMIVKKFNNILNTYLIIIIIILNTLC